MEYYYTFFKSRGVQVKGEMNGIVENCFIYIFLKQL